MNYNERIAQNAKLRILQELAEQMDGRMSIFLLQGMLNEKFGINQTIPWVEQQLRDLANLGAIDLVDSSVLIAGINRTGRDHLAERSALVGVTRPYEVR